MHGAGRLRSRLLFNLLSPGTAPRSLLRAVTGAGTGGRERRKSLERGRHLQRLWRLPPRPQAALALSSLTCLVRASTGGHRGDTSPCLASGRLRLRQLVCVSGGSLSDGGVSCPSSDLLVFVPEFWGRGSGRAGPGAARCGLRLPSV